MPFTKLGAYTYYAHINIANDAPDVVVEIGAYCSIASMTVQGYSHHDMTRVSTFPFKELWGAGSKKTGVYKGPTIIGDDVWIGENVLITGGLTIGTGAVVAARAVVTHDVPPYAIVAGVPARIIRMRFPPHIVDVLLESHWWTLSKEQLLTHMDDLDSSDETVIQAFAEKARALWNDSSLRCV